MLSKTSPLEWLRRVAIRAAWGWVALAPVAQAEAGLDSAERALQADLHARQDLMVETLRDWVDLNTGTWNGEGLSRFASILAGALEDLGFEVRSHDGVALDLPSRKGARTGPILLARREPARGEEGAPRLLLIGHMDTVFEAEAPFQRFALDPDHTDRARGPGVIDMKGGLVVMTEALGALHRSGDLDRVRVTVLLDSDEEIGSLGSRSAIETEARRADYGLVFEPARPSGSMVRARRGVGQFHLVVEGVGAHAGTAHEQGRSAIRELAEKIVRIERLTDYSRGLTVNVGIVSGGTKRNVVPDRAESWIDVRYDDPALGEEVKERIERIAAETFVPGTRTVVWGRLHRPPKVETARLAALLEIHDRVARDLGVKLLQPELSGGGTDGSLTEAQGLATLDSMGPVGGAAHTDGEYIVLSSLAERAAIAAVLILRLATMEPRDEALRASPP